MRDRSPALALRHPSRAIGLAALGTGVAGALLDSAWPGLAAVAAVVALSWRGRPDETAPETPAVPPREEVHPVSGMPTREPLLATMTADARGTLGVLAFRDYDRLCAFDPQAGDRVLRVLADRVRAMLPPSRMIAHVDRGHLAIWVDARLSRDAAERELKAAVYALGTAVADDSGAILPEVALRHVAFDAAAETPDVALARTIASFAVAEIDGDAAPAQQVTQARDRFLLEQDLRQALARAELRLAYQPLIDAGEGRVCGAEALLRWDRAGGAVPPAQFVPIMESAGLAREIGLWAMNAALRQTAEWAQLGLSPLRIAVNVSGQQMTDDDLPVVIARMLARHAVPADALEVELTESVALDDTGQAARLVRALRTQGVAVAIDDFGTGFSSLSTMRRLTFDKIKIDREFVTDVHRRRESQAICQSVIALGRGLGIRVLAEGVEQRAEVEWLRRHGCRYFQGYYFARPLAPADFARFAGDTRHLAALLANDVASLHRDIITRDSTRSHA